MKTSKGMILNQSKTKEASNMSEPHKWECPGCGAMNNSATKYCVACGKSKS